MSARQLAWRALYEVLAARVQRPEWAFMNYGYDVPPGTAAPALDAADEPRALLDPVERIEDGGLELLPARRLLPRRGGHYFGTSMGYIHAEMPSTWTPGFVWP